MLAYFVRYMLMLGHVGEQAPYRDIRHWLACFACYTLRFGYKNKQACFCIQTLCVFHVKHNRGWKAKINLFIFI